MLTICKDILGLDYSLPQCDCRKGRVMMPRNYIMVDLSVKWMHVCISMRRTQEVPTTHGLLYR